MIVKLVYQDLIHRVTDIPSELSDLRAIIMSSFKTTLPEGFSLSYTIAGEVENAPLATTEDYQALLAMEPESKTVKIIVGERKASGDYDIIAQTKEANYGEERKFEGDANNRGLAEFVENVSESVIIPQVQKYPYISGAQDQDDDKTKKIVREVLKEQLPFIISQVKDAVLKELRPLMPIYQQVNQPPKVQQQQQRPQERRFEEDKIEINPVPSEVIFERSHEVYGNEEQERQQNVQAGDKTDILDKMKKFGTALKDQLVVLPGKAKVAFDEVAQKLEGDPYITCEEGKYPKSVVEKANLLREIFPEEEKKVLLEFVKQYPRHANLEQLANLYLVKDEPQQAAAPEGQNNNA